MRYEAEIKELLIENAIHLIAEGGFEKATTRAIAGERREIGNVRLNEAHIYRVFGTKENLLAEVFSLLDDELVSVIQRNLSVFNDGKDFKAQCKTLFTELWRFLLQNESKCRYFTRYYYSVYFTDDIRRKHIKKYETLVKKMTPRFVEGADVWSLLHHIITVMLDFAIRVYNGGLEDREDNAYHIFNVVYSSIEPYLK